MAEAAKVGRHLKRSPAAASYRNGQRWIVNKDKAIEKDKQFKEKCAARKEIKKIVRGYTRFLRRKDTPRKSTGV